MWPLLLYDAVTVYIRIIHRVEKSLEALIRYGKIPEVARFAVLSGHAHARGARVVVRTHRGLMVGELLEEVSTSDAVSEEHEQGLLRELSAADQELVASQAASDKELFVEWQSRITEWNVAVELIDIEQTLDGEKLILYVLNERGPECTKLALRAATEGVGPIEVQPVSAEGLVAMESQGGGCGSCRNKHQ
ncbi:hypothetical protein [Calycomorphotria hydatis]|uniref:PSP1 C-terminal domain-containing protein n=1 Tax=Calycomorphotria hydatis TaxID=2528027 RepID=A0A517TDU3_9PLAN|nr:hypothetical protein [Calycomorphotria hydatis]QDT66537.1 hypothetical protein V22_38070 [Calycomorphotria hydatis]